MEHSAIVLLYYILLAGKYLLMLLQVAEQLRVSVLALYDKRLAADGRAVDYKGLGADPDFQLFVNATAELQRLDVSSLSREERMAFWINLYNILVVSCPRRVSPCFWHACCSTAQPPCPVEALMLTGHSSHAECVFAFSLSCI